MKQEKVYPMIIDNVSYTLVKLTKGEYACRLCCFDKNTCPDNGMCVCSDGYWKLTYSVDI